MCGNERLWEEPSQEGGGGAVKQIYHIVNTRTIWQPLIKCPHWQGISKTLQHSDWCNPSSTPSLKGFVTTDYIEKPIFSVCDVSGREEIGLHSLWIRTAFGFLGRKFMATYYYLLSLNGSLDSQHLLIANINNCFHYQIDPTLINCCFNELILIYMSENE